MHAPALKLLEARIYFSTWTGVLRFVFYDDRKNSWLAYSVETLSNGPRRTPGIEFSTDRLDGEAARSYTRCII
jgi:hypothetical protein